jgi:hypothetical protein
MDPTPANAQQQPANAKANADPALLAQQQPQQAGGPATSQLRFMLTVGQPTPADVAQLVCDNPGERDAIFGLLQQTLSNGFVQQVIAAVQAMPQPSAAPTKDIGPKPGGANAVANTPLNAPPVKNPADKFAAAPLGAQQADFERGIAPPESVFPGARATIGQQQQQPAYLGTNTPVQQAPGAPPVVAPDSNVTNNGVRTQTFNDTQPGLGGITTNTQVTKSVVAPTLPGQTPAPVSDEQKANDLRALRASVSAALDDQLKGEGAMTGSPAADVKAAQQVRIDQINAAKAAAAKASADDLMGIIKDNNLLVKPPESLLSSTTVQTTRGTNVVGRILDGSAIVTSGAKQTTVTNAGTGTTTETGETKAALSTKGVDLGVSSATSKVDPGAGTSSSVSVKAGVTGGITEPLRAGLDIKTAQANAATSSSTKVEGSVGVQAGNGFGGATGSIKYGKGDAAKQDPAVPTATAKPEADPNAPAPDANAPASTKPGALAGFKPTVTASGQVGVLQNENGTGVGGSGAASLDAGAKSIAAGAYGSVDGGLQILVTPTPDGGVVVTLTASLKAKLGGFLGKRGPDEPVESGSDWSAGGGVGIQGARQVTRSRKLSKDDATRLLGELDGLASGRSPDGKKTFGTRAAEAAYKSIFGGDIHDLMTADPKPGPGETVEVSNEAGFGVEGKGGASGGDSKGARGSVGATAGYDSVALTGHTESESNGVVTYTVKFGHRTKANVGGSAGFGSASGSAGVNETTQQVTSYVFAVPTAKADLLAQVRALANEDAAKQFQAVHPDLAPGTVKNNLDASGNTVGVSVGPAGMEGGSTSTVEQNIGAGHHMAIGPDGKPIKQNDLSGTIAGKRDDTASASLLGVKVAQAKETNEAKGTVEANGQTSLDVTTSTSGSNAIANAPKGAAALGATDKTDLAMMGATGGPMAYLKKLAESTGEISTVGAHFDPASFDILVATAADPNRWMKAILGDYRGEWAHLGAVLRSPNPPADWIKQDGSPGHAAAFQLTRIKAIATFMSVAGDKGAAAIASVRGAIGSNEVGQTVSWPPSLQGEKPNFDDLARKVEHLKPTLSPYAQAGDKDGGTAFLTQLMTALDALHTKILNAPDHANQVAAVHAGEGILGMEQTVTTYQTRFTAALAAHDAKKAVGEIEAALDGQPPKSAALASKVTDQAQIAAKAHADGDAVPVPYKGTDKQWAAHDKKVNDLLSTEANAVDQKAQTEAQQRQAQNDEAVERAKAQMPAAETTCADAKGRAFKTLDSAFYGLPTGYIYGGGSESDLMPKLLGLGQQMNDWLNHWNKLHDLYKTCNMPEGFRNDLKPLISSSHLRGIADCQYISSDNTKGYVRELLNRWGGPF